MLHVKVFKILLIKDFVDYPCGNVTNIRNTFAAYFEGDGAIP